MARVEEVCPCEYLCAQKDQEQHQQSEPNYSVIPFVSRVGQQVHVRWPAVVLNKLVVHYVRSGALVPVRRRLPPGVRVIWVHIQLICLRISVSCVKVR